MASPLNGWHRGERAIQRKLNFDGPMALAYTMISCEMPPEDREFHTTRLPFLPITTLDASGRPWSSIVAGPSGEPGFISSPDYSTLIMDIRVWEGDPLLENMKRLETEESMLVAAIGIEFSTRRRNKFAGRITRIEREASNFRLELQVNQAIGNCPKYINVRDLIPHPTTNPTVVYNEPHLQPEARLPDELIQFIHASDTVFIGTSYEALKGDEARFPSHVGQNQRGGRPGFVRVRPSDGRTLVLPDYSGNRLLTSLGNIEATPLASLSFLSYTTGTILYLTGSARTLVGAEAQALMPRQNVVTTVEVTGYTFVRDALPVRQRPGTGVQRSPYSPPVRLLAEELAAESSALYYTPKEGDKDGETPVYLTLARIDLLSADLATFAWELSDLPHRVQIKPGQAAVIDFSDFVGKVGYQHMAPWNPVSVNDDRIRTWTISSAHLPRTLPRSHSHSNSSSTDAPPEGLELTMRERPNGVVTGALFTLSRKLAAVRPELMVDARPLGLRVKLVGIVGDFTLGRGVCAGTEAYDGVGSTRKVLWVAGGIGITPFLSMLKGVVAGTGCGEESEAESEGKAEWDIVLMLATREPEVLLPLIFGALGDASTNGSGCWVRLALDVFSNGPVPDSEVATVPNGAESERVTTTVTRHKGRVTHEVFGAVKDLKERDAYVCGPGPFEESVLELLEGHGVRRGSVRREEFTY